MGNSLVRAGVSPAGVGMGAGPVPPVEPRYQSAKGCLTLLALLALGLGMVVLVIIIKGDGFSI